MGRIGTVVTVEPDGAYSRRLCAGHVVGKAVAHVDQGGGLELRSPQRGLVEPRVRFPHPEVLGEDREIEVPGQPAALRVRVAVRQQPESIAAAQRVERREDIGVQLDVTEPACEEVVGQMHRERRIRTTQEVEGLRERREPDLFHRLALPVELRGDLVARGDEVVGREGSRGRAGHEALEFRQRSRQRLPHDALEIPQGAVGVEGNSVDDLLHHRSLTAPAHQRHRRKKHTC